MQPAHVIWFFTEKAPGNKNYIFFTLEATSSLRDFFCLESSICARGGEE